MPVVLYLLEGGGTIRREVYRHDLLGDRPLELRYWSVGLPNLSASRYVVQGGALAGALGALMRPGRWSRVRQKAECLKAILSAHEDATTSLVAWRCVERYLKLDEAAEQQAMGLLRKDGYEMDLRASEPVWITEIRDAGRVEGMQTLLLNLMTLKFGRLNPDIESWVRSITEPAKLDRLSERVLVAETLEDLREGV